jgi:magnesium chelatase subunit D
MSPDTPDAAVDTDALWADALTAAALLAVDPAGLGGALLRARAGPQRALWLAALRHSLPGDVPLRRVPLGIADDRLLGGLDLAGTLQTGRPVAQRGVLAEADGGVLVLAMAERLAAGTVARVAAALDTGHVRMERDGLTLLQPARLGVVALDEGVDDDECASPVLADRLAFHLVLDRLPAHGPGARPNAAAETDAASLDALLAVSADDVAGARARLAQVASGDGTATALCRAAVALGIDSLRAPWLALRAACAAAALQGHESVEPDDAALAARLVLGPRATRFPAPPEAEPPPQDQAPPEPPPAEPPPDAPPPEPPPATDAAADPPPDPPADDAPPPPPDPTQALDEVVLEAALASMPAGLLAQLKAGATARSPAQSAGKAGALQPGGPRGRPLGARRGELRPGARLDLIATLRAAAPWQRLRQHEAARAAAAHASAPAAPRRVLVQPEDFHISRRAQRRETTTLFVVDASGSAALHRLAEAKGAVELLLADCYVRRDRVALLAFRGSSAELVLPPTRSLVRAKRALAGLPGGGGTPLALALDAAAALASTLLRRGGTPVLVLLTDARANIARDGSPGRDLATLDALASARQLRALGVGTLMVDTSPGSARTAPAGAGPSVARVLADSLAALYLPLPQMDAARLSQAAKALSAAQGRQPA